MAWIESHQSLSRHRKTLRAATLLQVDRHKLIGHLHELWWWGLDNVGSSGAFAGALDEEIAAGAEWDGDPAAFVSALIQAGFVDVLPEGRFIHDWYEFAGKLLDRRADNRQRQQTFRNRHRASSIEGRNGYVTRDVGVNNAATVPNPTVPTKESSTTPVDPIAPAVPDAMQAHRNGTFSKADRDAMWEAVTAECGDAVMPQAKSRRGKVVGQLLAAHYAPAQVKVASETYRRRYEVDLTDTALASHIDRLLTTDDPIPRAPPERPSRAAALSQHATDTARRIDDARQHAAAGRKLSALHPELRGLPS